MATTKQKLTQEGYDKLQAELNHLEKDIRKEIAEKLNEAKAFGDLSENAAYSAAVEQRDLNEAKIAEIKDILDNSEIIEADEEDRSDGRIGIGSKVVIQDESGEEIAFEVVGAGETDIMKKRFDINSPLVEAALERKEGDKINVKLEDGEAIFAIKSVK